MGREGTDSPGFQIWGEEIQRPFPGRGGTVLAWKRLTSDPDWACPIHPLSESWLFPLHSLSRPLRDLGPPTGPGWFSGQAWQGREDQLAGGGRGCPSPLAV